VKRPVHSSELIRVSGLRKDWPEWMVMRTLCWGRNFVNASAAVFSRILAAAASEYIATSHSCTIVDYNEYDLGSILGLLLVLSWLLDKKNTFILDASTVRKMARWHFNAYIFQRFSQLGVQISKFDSRIRIRGEEIFRFFAIADLAHVGLLRANCTHPSCGISFSKSGIQEKSQRDEILPSVWIGKSVCQLDGNSTLSKGLEYLLEFKLFEIYRTWKFTLQWFVCISLQMIADLCGDGATCSAFLLLEFD